MKMKKRKVMNGYVCIGKRCCLKIMSFYEFSGIQLILFKGFLFVGIFRGREQGFKKFGLIVFIVIGNFYFQVNKFI